MAPLISPSATCMPPSLPYAPPCIPPLSPCVPPPPPPLYPLRHRLRTPSATLRHLRTASTALRAACVPPPRPAPPEYCFCHPTCGLSTPAAAVHAPFAAAYVTPLLTPSILHPAVPNQSKTPLPHLLHTRSRLFA